MPATITIGLMSGTSTDGVDGVMAQFAPEAPPRMLACHSLPLPAALRQELLALNHPGPNELERAALAANQLADLYAQVVAAVLAQSGLGPAHIAAIGAHGQTVRHDPANGYTVQLNAPARLAEHTGIAVIADFRSRDIAAGGQGAPLVPAVHQALFSAAHPRVILNLGGIANLTVLHPQAALAGFDSGPANLLMDAWIREKQGLDFDADGAWAASGRCDAALLALLLQDPWLAQAPPKSTGRHHFNRDWLAARLAQRGAPLADADVQATLLAFTVATIAQAVRRHAPDTAEVLACGGGARNTALMQALAQALPCPLDTTARLGVDPQWVEALAFAWLAHAWGEGRPAGIPSVTGARAARVLGCCYPAR